VKNDRVLKDHTKSATILFYVSKELQTHNGQALIDIQSGASESEVNIQEGEGEDDAESTSSSESECNNLIPQDQEGEGEDDAKSTSSSISECNNRITQDFFTTSPRPLLLNMSGATFPYFNGSGDILNRG